MSFLTTLRDGREASEILGVPNSAPEIVGVPIPLRLGAKPVRLSRELGETNALLEGAGHSLLRYS